MRREQRGNRCVARARRVEVAALTRELGQLVVAVEQVKHVHARGDRTRDDVGNSHSVDRSADATAYDEAGVGAAVDEMTRKDRALFGVAARRLFRDARRVEKERNTRIFCGDSRRALQRYAAIRLNRTLA